MEKFTKWRDPGTGLAPFLQNPFEIPNPKFFFFVFGLILFLVRHLFIFILFTTYLVFIHLLLSPLLQPIFPKTLHFFKKIFIGIVFVLCGTFLEYSQIHTYAKRKNINTSPSPGDVVISCCCSPLDVLYLTFKYNPIFTICFSDTPFVKHVSGIKLIFYMLSTPKKSSYKDCVTLDNLSKLYPNRIICVFPEGTTSNGCGLLLFTQSLQSIAPQSKVFPLSIKYDPYLTTPHPGSLLTFLFRFTFKLTHKIRIKTSEAPIIPENCQEKLSEIASISLSKLSRIYLDTNMKEIQKQLNNCKITEKLSSIEQTSCSHFLDSKKKHQTEHQKDIHCAKSSFITYERNPLKMTKSIETHKNISIPSSEHTEYRKNSFSFPNNNLAFSSLELSEDILHIQNFSGITKLHEQSFIFHEAPSKEESGIDIFLDPPSYITSNLAHNIFQSKILSIRTLTHQDALKKVIHFDLDVKDYPLSKNENWIVGGFIEICIPNLKNTVDEIFELLNISQEKADEQIILETKNNNFLKLWNITCSQKIKTTRRNIMTWMVDIQSSLPKKALLRLLAEYATNEFDKKILFFLCSKEGQKAFLNLRSQKYITLSQLLHAFPSSKPPFAHLLSVLSPICPRRYSFSNDPSLSHGILQIAASIIKVPDWKGDTRYGLASAYFEQIFHEHINIKKKNSTENISCQLTIPIFKGNDQNPLSKEPYAPGPRIFIGVGVGIAPFRAFVQNRLQNTSCFEEIWVIQGCRNAKLDEIYHGEWGLLNASQNRIIVESRSGKKEHVQDEVKRRGKLIWDIINSKDGRIYVCGIGAPYIKSLDDCFIEIAMEWGGYNREDAVKKWKEFENPLVLKYIKEIW
ncbi:hypothetical protein PORY_001573 [Pneumocystis oryctolagi]|uniref:Uncharacterized protein n=1 Tax=Pneumocystis oryctolagi TaxID=42067 RepID=A0ACB7CD81_9ASCO|nr:hypothetical protein PORY_001573 [Pneumocystis oryctolagi]